MRFSLKWMLAAVALVGFGCVALHNANEYWADAAMGATSLALLAAILGSIYMHPRSFYIGAAVFGWGYLFVTYAPMRGDPPTLGHIREEDAVVDEAALEKIHAQSLQKALHEELSLLPDTYRGPLILCYLENRTREEAAAELESTEASVKARLARGKQMLRLRLARRGLALTPVMAVTVPDIADATQPVRKELVDKTVSAPRNGPSLPECSTEVISLVKEGGRAMVRSMMVKSALVTACVLGTVCLTWSSRAGDRTAREGTALVDLDAATQIEPASRDGGPFVGVAQDPLASPTVPIQALQVQRNVEDANLAKQRLQIRKGYLLRKAKAYELLSAAMRSKAKQADNEIEKLDATGRAELYAAEAYQLEKHAELVDEEMKLLDVQSAGPATSETTRPRTIQPGQTLRVEVLGTPPDRRISGIFLVEPEGTVPLGPGYGRVDLGGLSLEDAEAKLKEHLQKHLKSPEVQITFKSSVRR